MIDLNKFVRYAQKHAPELDVTLGREGVWIGDLAHYAPNGTWRYNWDFAGELLEYLKGLKAPNKEAFERLLIARCKPWESLTPEAVMQACINVWEAME